VGAHGFAGTVVYSITNSLAILQSVPPSAPMNFV
jgi:hypothetical protein